jgi:hypothetical protein
MATIQKLSLDFTAGVTKNQMETIVNKINEVIDGSNKVLIREINLNQEYNDPSKVFTVSEALMASKDIIRAYGLRLRFLSNTGRYVEYSYLGTTLSDEDWLLESNWCTGVDLIDGGEI